MSYAFKKSATRPQKTASASTQLIQGKLYFVFNACYFSSGGEGIRYTFTRGIFIKHCYVLAMELQKQKGTEHSRPRDLHIQRPAVGQGGISGGVIG
jgi:hypothetical protein